MSDYETTQRNRNIAVGIFVLIAMCALIWLIYKFGELPSKVSKIGSYKVYVQFAAARGIDKDTPVQFCGYQIGRVTQVDPPLVLPDVNTKRKYHQSRVILNIDKKFSNIPTSSDIKLMTRGLGSSYIEIKAPVPEPNQVFAKFLEDGSLVQGSTGTTSEFFPEETQRKMENLVETFGDLIKNFNDILGDPDNKQNIKQTLSNLTIATEEATNTLKEIQDFTNSEAANTLKDIQAFTKSAVDVTGELSSTIAQTRLMFQKINEGQGTAGKVVNDGQLYEDMLETIQQLNLLLQDIKDFVQEYREKGIKINL